MDFGQGIAKAGDYFSQAIMGRHEEQERIKREALAQQNQEAENQWRRSQVERQNANDLFNQSIRMAETAAPGTSMSPEAAMRVDPRVRDAFMDHRPAELPSRDIQLGGNQFGGESAAPRGERFEFKAPYRKQEAVQGLRNEGAAEVAGIRGGTAERVARIKSQMTEYQRLSLEVARARTDIARQSLLQRMKQLKMTLEQRDADNLLDNQTAYDLQLIREQGDDPGFKPTVPRPTGGKKTSTASGTDPKAAMAALGSSLLN